MTTARFCVFLCLLLILVASCGSEDAESELDTQAGSSVSPTSEPTDTPAPQSSPTLTPSNVGIWHPPVETTWQWQLTDQPIDTSFDADMYDIDLFDNDARIVADLHSQGRKVVC